MSLRLHIATHDAEGEEWPAILQHHRRNQRVKWPLPRRNHIRMLRVEAEQRAAILKHNAGIAGDESGTKMTKQTVDE